MNCKPFMEKAALKSSSRHLLESSNSHLLVSTFDETSTERSLVPKLLASAGPCRRDAECFAGFCGNNYFGNAGRMYFVISNLALMTSCRTKYFCKSKKEV